MEVAEKRTMCRVYYRVTGTHYAIMQGPFALRIDTSLSHVFQLDAYDLPVQMNWFWKRPQEEVYFIGGLVQSLIASGLSYDMATRFVDSLEYKTITQDEALPGFMIAPVLFTFEDGSVLRYVR